ncbi:multidrug resistance protein A [Brucella sp. F5/99]|nr:multidrug resistance protein A [Brucella sp. F5/99]
MLGVESTFDAHLLVKIGLVEHFRHQVALFDADAMFAGENPANLYAKPQDIRAEILRRFQFSRIVCVIAARDLSFTSLRAPFDGVIGNLSGKKGDLVAPGQKIAALVPVDQLYIDANFKETQLAHIKVGETAHIYVDAIDGTKFDGKVASIAPASGAVFSLLPPENATGNFTKVVQRVPVRITIPKEAFESGKIRAGLSVIVDVDTRTAPDQTAN